MLSPVDASGIATFVTAAATVVLCVVTWVLAKETRRLARLNAQPQVVASVVSNKWASGFADLHVENSGNATAFDVTVKFDPPLETEPVDEGDPPPLQRISVLKPGQALTSFLCDYRKIIDQTYEVTTSWRRDPARTAREQLCYKVRIADIRGSSQLGEGDPIIQISQGIKKLSEDFNRLTSGWRRPRVDVYTSADRRKDLEEAMRAHEERKAGQAHNE